MRALFLATTAAIFGLLAAPAVFAADDMPISWGKANVSYVQYRADSKKCAFLGLDVALEQKPPAMGSQGINNSLDDMLQRNQMVALETRRIQHVAGQAAIDQCLTELGYRRFRLTAQQVAHMQALSAGSDARHQYLYSLGDDASVLAAQTVEDNSAK